MSTVPASESVQPPSPTVEPSPVLMYEFGPFHLDPIGRQLRKEGEVVPLTAKVFETLLVLVRNHERPVTKEDLINAVWPGTFVSDDSLVQNISALRRALGDDTSQPRYIVTLARRGYRFIAPTLERTELGTSPDTTVERPSDVLPAPSVTSPPVGIAGGIRSDRWAVIGAAFVAGLAVAFLAWILSTRAPTEVAGGSPLRFLEQIPRGHALRSSGAISPDGRQLAFAAQDSAGSRIWVRQLDAPDARPLSGTEDGSLPFWSPDGQFIGFIAAGEMKRLELSTGTVRTIAPTHRVRPLGASWGPGDVVLYADLGKIFSVPATGGEPKEVADSGPSGEGGELRWPQMLVDGTHFIFYASGDTPEHSGTFLGSLGSRDTTRLIQGFRATYAPPNHLLYARDQTLIAQTFDITSGRLDGPPMTVPGGAWSTTTFSASNNGILVSTELAARQQLVWLDRHGKSLGKVDISKEIADLTLSPDGQKALVASIEAGAYDLWLVDLARTVATKVASEGTFPAWAPDGNRFAFTHVSADGADLYVRSATGAPQEAIWLKTKELKSVNSWSPDGRFIVFAKYTTKEETSTDLWLLPTSGDHKPFPYLQTKARERSGIISPDGRWIAYASDETGASEVYVQSFPTAGAKVRISTGGGSQPLWRRDGRELFYVAADRRLMSVALAPGQESQPSVPQPLFELPAVSSASRQVDVTADGQRFLVVDWDASNQDGRVSLLTNWLASRRP